MFKLCRIFLGIFFVLLISGCATSSPNKISNPSQAAHLNAVLGMQYFALHENLLAQEKLQKALELDPNSPEANSAMGYYLWKIGQSDQAKIYYSKASYLAPNDPDILNAEGVYLCGTGEFKSGIQSFLKAAQIPGFLALGLTYQNAGSCAYESGDPELKTRSINYFQKALQADPLLPLADLRLAELYFDQKNLAQARIYLKRFNDIADPTEESRYLEKQMNFQA